MTFDTAKSPEELDDRRDRGPTDRRSGWTVERLLLIMTLACSATAFIFGIGVQWARTTQVEASVKAMQDGYLPREIYTIDQRRMSEALDRLTRAIDDMAKQQVADERAHNSREDVRDRAARPAPAPAFGKQ